MQNAEPSRGFITAHNLLMSCPDTQIKRCQIAFNAIAEGRWEDAAFTLRNAANEEGGQWAREALELAEHVEANRIQNMEAL